MKVIESGINVQPRPVAGVFNFLLTYNIKLYFVPTVMSINSLCSLFGLDIKQLYLIMLVICSKATENELSN